MIRKAVGFFALLLAALTCGSSGDPGQNLESTSNNARPKAVTLAPTGAVVPAQALNLSTRLQVGIGNMVGIGGFIITGTSPKQIYLRGIGPSLGNFGVPNPLADPVLELHGPNETIINDNWMDPPIVILPFPPNDALESAIMTLLDPGPYTVVLRGNGTGMGIGLVEMYDLNQGSPSKLANLSTRGFVGTNDDIMISGFILGGGTGGDLVVIRGLGLSVGVQPPLADPRLELRDSSGNLLAANENWQDDSSQAAIVSALGLAPGDPSEAAIALSLSPGSYTGLLIGANNGTGIGVIEVYDNPATPTPIPTATPVSSATPTPTPGGMCVENFDGVTAPALPSGWTATNLVPGDGVMFTTVTSTVDSPPNSAFIPDQDGISDKVMDSRPVTINSASAVLTFRNNFNTEFSSGKFLDGGVLEISSPNISGGDFVDFTDPQVGATCMAGCYTGPMGSLAGPITGRMLWAGDSMGFIDTVIDLGPNLSGQTITLRFRFFSDQAVAAPGWWIDTLSITNSACP